MQFRKDVTHKAIIQTSKHTGVNRVLYRKKIDGVTRVVETHAGNLSRYSVTGYASLWQVANTLTDCIIVGPDEPVVFGGGVADYKLGVPKSQVKYNTIMGIRNNIKRKFGLTDTELDSIIREAA